MIRIYIFFMLVCCFTMSTVLDAQFSRLRAKTDTSAGIITAIMGDSRRMFANHFFAEADAYFHSGFYPTIFDSQRHESSHLTGESHEHDSGHDDHHEETFLGPPRDWIERFGRHFIPNVHTHLSHGEEGEILPWLRISAMLDPKRVDTYITASYWLRTSLQKPDEGERFLREGLRANPDSYAILLELGRVYFYSKNDPRIARNIFALARNKWLKQEADGEKPEPADYEEILGEIVRVDRQQGDLKAVLTDLEQLAKVSHSPDTLQAEIREVQQKLAGPK